MSGIPIEREAADEILEAPFTQEMFMNGFNLEPFVNELARIRHSIKCLKQKHGDKKLKIRPQYEQEIENTRKKYDLFLKIEDAAFKKDKALLEELRQKVERGLSVDKEFKAHFVEQMKADASHEGPVKGQLSNFILGQAPPRYQVETLRTGSIFGPAPPRGVVERVDSSSILDLALSRTLRSAIEEPTGT